MKQAFFPSLSATSIARIGILCALAMALHVLSVFSLSLNASAHNHHSSDVGVEHDHEAVAHHSHNLSIDSAASSAQWADSEAHHKFAELNEDASASATSAVTSAIPASAPLATPPSLGFLRPNKSNAIILASRQTRIERPPWSV